MIAIVDTGLDEIHQIHMVLSDLRQDTVITAEKEVLSKSDQIILYSTSSFGETMYGIQKKNLVNDLKYLSVVGKRLVGIGTGMQVFFTSSDEGGFFQGLNLFPGRLVPLPECSKGLNWVSFKYSHPLIRDLEEGYGYFAHSFYVKAMNEDDVVALNEQGVPAIVGRRNILGMQFYPEKSDDWKKQLCRLAAAGQ